MKKTVSLAAIFIVLISTPVRSQLAMGKWRTHLAYNNVSEIEQSDNKVYAVSEGSLYSIDKLDRNIEFYSKITGLNGYNITRIGFDSTNKQLVIAYANGNIDIMGSGGVTNVPDLYNKQMSANKGVNHILFSRNKAYLSCNFGILALNLQKKEISDTYFIGPNASEVKVLATAVSNGNIYALTPTALYEAPVNDPFLINYQKWKTTGALPDSGVVKSIVSFAGKIFLHRGERLYFLNNDNTWSAFLPELSVSGFSTSDGIMCIYSSNSVYIADNQLNIKNIPNLSTISDAEYDTENSTYWFAANSNGVVTYKENGTSNPIKPAGPAVNMPWDMTFSGDKLFVVPGGRWSDQNHNKGKVMMYEDGNWINIYGEDIQTVTGRNPLDFLNVAVDPTDEKHFYVTAYGTGLYEFKNNTFFKLHDFTNSSIASIFSNDINYMRIDGAIFDKDGNLFLTNTSVNSGIVIRMANGEWKNLYYPGVSSKPTLGRILISNQNPNQKWVMSVRSIPGICVFDDNGTLTNQTDDKSTFISDFIYPETDKNNQTTAVKVSPGSILCMAQDKNGVVWVGTEQGPFLFSNLTKVFDTDYTCSRVKIPRNDSTNLADYLLKDEKIKAIAIDGANRKWIGTESSGVYLMSENGQETIQHFTTSNSPLLSNDILSIAINPKSGEVYFGTGLGIISYQGDAVEAGETFGDVHAYPNPVREGYNGVITITGLVKDTQVKITDIAGNLVCETVSNGSIAIWDGKDVHGRKVSTGVYLAICANADGTQSTITKILVIN